VHFLYIGYFIYTIKVPVGFPCSLCAARTRVSGLCDYHRITSMINTTNCKIK
jgi:hypothetical protein